MRVCVSAKKKGKRYLFSEIAINDPEKSSSGLG